MLEEELSRFRLGDRRLRRLYRRSILVFSELRQGNLRSGDARQIASRLLQDLGGDELRTTVETALNLSGLAYSTVSASRSSRRALWLTLLGTVVAIVVALPQIQALLDAVTKWKASQPWDFLLHPIQVIATWSPWGVLVAAVGIVMAFWLLLRFIQFTRALFSVLFPRRGYPWPNLISVTREPFDHKDDADA